MVSPWFRNHGVMQSAICETPELDGMIFEMTYKLSIYHLSPKTYVVFLLVEDRTPKKYPVRETPLLFTFKIFTVISIFLIYCDIAKLKYSLFFTLIMFGSLVLVQLVQRVHQ